MSECNPSSAHGRRFFVVIGLLVLLVVAVGYLVAEQAGIFRRTDSTITFASAPFPPLKFAARDDLELHYVAVDESLTGDPIVISFDEVDRPFVLVLASRDAVSWQLEKPPTRHLRSILLAARNANTTVTGVPRGVEVYGVLPHDHLVAVELAPVCPGSRGCLSWSRHGELPLQRVERALLEVVGRRIDTFAAARKTNALTVPGIVVTEEMRAAVEREATRLREEQEREMRLEIAEKTFEARFKAERQQDLTSVLARHPELDLRRLAGITERVKIVSVQGGLTTDYDRHARLVEYEEFRANALRQIGQVQVRLATDAPTFLVLLSYDPVVWSVVPEGRTTITGVLVSSHGISTISELPPDVPLEILAAENGDLKYYRNITEPGQEMVLLEDLAVFSGIPTDIQTYRRTSTIAAR
jgi:hypothetical protein